MLLNEHAPSQALMYTNRQSETVAHCDIINFFFSSRKKNMIVFFRFLLYNAVMESGEESVIKTYSQNCVHVCYDF